MRGWCLLQAGFAFCCYSLVDCAADLLHCLLVDFCLGRQRVRLHGQPCVTRLVACVTVVGRATAPLEPQLHQNMREKEQCEGEQQMY